jgi:4-nitrophenyl phosphatase
MQMGGDPATDCSLDLSKYDNFLFDCDGVLWAGAHALPGSIETVRALQLQGKVTKFITNNSTSSRRTYASKFAGLGLEVSMDDIVTSGSALAEYISTRDPPVKAAYVIGEDGFVEELELRGVRCVRTGKSRGGAMSEEEFARLRADEDVTCVAVGWDREFSFRQIAIASHYLQQPSCRLFAGCNPDASDRVGPFLMPGTGALLAAVERASGVSPVVVGKPNSLLIKQILVRGGMEPQRTIMFGDRIDTDIAFGIAGGIDTALVLSGVCSEEDARSSMLRPTYILPRLGVMQEVAMSGSAISE